MRESCSRGSRSTASACRECGSRPTLPRCRSLVLAAAGDLPGALSAVDEGVKHPAAGKLPFELARTLLIKGQLHRRVKQKLVARDSLTQSLEIFERLGRADLGRARPRRAQPGRAELVGP